MTINMCSFDLPKIHESFKISIKDTVMLQVFKYLTLSLATQKSFPED